MQRIISDNEKIEKLIQYYKDTGLLLVGLNDSQGVNTTTTFFKKGLLEYLATALTSKELTPDVINAFSLTMNKTEHIDYFFKNNLSLEEIRLSQIYSAVSAFEKVMTDVGLPKFLGKVGYLYGLVYAPKDGDEKIKIATSLREAKEPIVVYSSGVNDLMREVGANPFGIKRNYDERYIKPNYYYTLEKTKNPETLRNVMDSIERNYNTILEINSQSDIYTLGAYIPKSLQSEEMDIFRYLVMAYNEELANLCNQYGITFVDTEEVGKKYNNSESNFHISTAGHNALANYLLGYMYYNKLEAHNFIGRENISSIEITNKGAQGVMESILCDYGQSCEKAAELSGYPKERQEAITAEREREAKIFEKVLAKKAKTKMFCGSSMK